MFSLIITVIAIVLVIILAVGAIYYGGGAFSSGAIKVVAQTLSNQSLQISAARALARAQNRVLTAGETVSIPSDLLRSIPVPPKGAYSDGVVPSSNDWVYYLPGASGHFGIALKINEKACMEVNRTQGFIGIPAAWDGRTSIQCFGPSDSGYTYLYEPTGTTTDEHTAALDKSVADARVTIPTAAPGYPRKCPDKSKITSGVCPGGVAPPPVDTGFWVFAATADGNYTTTLSSQGFSATCPAGAIDPTGPDAVSPASLPGDTYNADGLVTFAWGNFSADPVGAPLARTWCIPAVESDVTFTGPIPTSPALTYGEVSDTVLATTAPTVVEEDWVWSENSLTTITANGVQWSLMASIFSIDTYNPEVIDSAVLLGQKLAIGQGPRPNHSFFANSTVYSEHGYQYQLLSGKIQFSPVLPACDVLPPMPLGTGGRIVSIAKSTRITVILKQDGSVWGTGDSYYDDFGLCEYSQIDTWRVIATNVKSVSLHAYGILLVKTDGSLWMSGLISSGNAGPNFLLMFEFDRFTQIVPSGVASAAAGTEGPAYTTYLGTDGIVRYVGANRFAIAGTGTVPTTAGARFRTFQDVQAGIIRLEANGGNMFTLRSDKTLWATGSSAFYKLGIAEVLAPGQWFTTTPGMVPLQVGADVMDFAWSSYATVFVRTDGSVYAAGRNMCSKFGAAGTYFQTFTRIAPEIGSVARVWMTDNRISLLGTNGTLWEAGCEVSVAGATPADSPTFTAILTNVALYSPGIVAHYMDTSGNLFARGIGGTPGMYGNGPTAATNAWQAVPY